MNSGKGILTTVTDEIIITLVIKVLNLLSMPLVLKGKFVLFIFDKYNLNGMEQDIKILQIFPFNMHRAETLRLRLKGSQYNTNMPIFL